MAFLRAGRRRSSLFVSKRRLPAVRSYDSEITTGLRASQEKGGDITIDPPMVSPCSSNSLTSPPRLRCARPPICLRASLGDPYKQPDR
jgi:hypothetical protein